jgi:hypothetical protein
VTPTCLVARAGPCDGESASTQGTITSPSADKRSAQPSRVSPVDAQKGYVGTPTNRNALSLLFPFHSPAPWEASQCGVDAEPQVFMLLLLRYGLETKALIFFRHLAAASSITGCQFFLGGGAIRRGRCGQGAPRPTAQACAPQAGLQNIGRWGRARRHADRLPPSNSGRRFR